MNSAICRHVKEIKQIAYGIHQCKRIRNLMARCEPHNRIAKITSPPSNSLLTPVSGYTGPALWKRGFLMSIHSSSTRHLTTTTAAAVPLKKKKMTKLTEDERTVQLQPLLDAGWTMVAGRDAIYKEYLFADFNQAFSFMTAVALLAEKTNHHPEWFNVYNKVQVTMSTHDVGGLSTKDIRAANFMEKEAKRFL